MVLVLGVVSFLSGVQRIVSFAGLAVETEQNGATD